MKGRVFTGFVYRELLPVRLQHKPVSKNVPEFLTEIKLGVGKDGSYPLWEKQAASANRVVPRNMTFVPSNRNESFLLFCIKQVLKIRGGCIK